MILDRLRVLDLSGITAGGRTTQLLGDFGADVIKVESPHRPDPFRHWSGVTGETGQGDLGSPPFRVVGRNKRGITLDLKDPAGVAAFGRLVAGADLVVENFRRGVLERLGIGFATLRAWNPTVVLLSISSQGDGGPERDYVSFGGTLEALGGLMSVTGYGPDEPVWTTSKVNFPDQAVALLAPGLAVAAVLRSRRERRALHIDLSQRETVISLLGELVVEASLTGRTPRPTGNLAPGETTFCVPTAGTDEWCVISLFTDRDWERLTEVTGRGDLRTDPRFADGDARRAHVAQLVAEVAGWTRERDKSKAMAELQAAGVPAAEVLRGWELESRAAERGEPFHVPVPTSDGGTEQQLSWPFTIDGPGQPRIRRRAPHVGEHTDEVLAGTGQPTTTDTPGSTG
jgi:crotonobetainyl-CoA:carnitine CoA-transferase CaiB-like acyl-CoA transferase